MRKLLALLLTLTLALGLLAGCGQTQPTETEQTDETAANQTENTGDLQKIVITEDVRGYHWAPAYLAQTLATSPKRAWTQSSRPSRGATPLRRCCPGMPSSA